MPIVLADCETDGFQESYTKMHCISTKLKGSTSPPHLWTDMEAFASWAQDFKDDKWCFHNGLGFDIDAVNDLTPFSLRPEQILDTMVVSKTVDYGRFSGHSLKELGVALKVHKGDYTGGWETYSSEMGDYCVQDVVVLEAILKSQWKYITDPAWSKALKVEHEMAHICSDMKSNGFPFAARQAQELLDECLHEMKFLEDRFQEAFGSKLQEVNRILYRTKGDGTLFKNVEEALDKYPKTKVEGNELVCYDYIAFNPGSPLQRIDVLHAAGWKPFEKTKGHIAAERARRSSWKNTKR